MGSWNFFLDLMRSLDAAFLARLGVGPSPSEDWGERFFEELARHHPQWMGHKLSIYIKACEILNYFAHLGRAEEMGPTFYQKPEALLNMVIMLLRCDAGNPTSGDAGEPIIMNNLSKIKGS